MHTWTIATSPIRRISANLSDQLGLNMIHNSRVAQCIYLAETPEQQFHASMRRPA